MTSSLTAVGTADGIPTDFLSPAQVASALGIARSALYGLLARRALPHHRVGRLVRIRESDVAKYLAATRIDARVAESYARRPQT